MGFRLSSSRFIMGEEELACTITPQLTERPVNGWPCTVPRCVVEEWRMSVFTQHPTYSLHAEQSFLRNQPVLNHSKISPHFTEPEGSLPHSQVPATCPPSERDQSSPQHHIPFPEDFYLFSRLSNVSTSSCAHLAIIFSSSSSCLCHSSLLPLIPFQPIGPLIPFTHVSLGLPRFLSGGFHFITSGVSRARG